MTNRPSDGLNIHLSQQYSGQSAFALNVDLTLPNTGVTALFGPSGSGKTTLLRCIAGLEKNQQGHIRLNNDQWQDHHTSLPTHRRPIGYVFQDAKLFPHLTAQQNLQFAIQRADKTQTVISSADVIRLMNIESILSQYPAQLSGGERQRVAIARALLIQPKLLLMDEPLAALDETLKQDILPYLERLCRSAKIPILYVSHSLDEVIRLADYMVVLAAGKVIEQGQTQALLGKLGTSFSRYQDASVIIAGTVNRQETEWGLSWLGFDGQAIAFKQAGEKIGDAVRLRIQSRDVSLSLSKQEDSSILNRLTVVIDEIENDPKDPSMTMVRLLAGQTPILAKITRLSAHHLNLKKGQIVIAQIKSVAVLS
ncbi:molybdenum ABC transporter ATP-binding protein [Marinomonas sp. M1K-6]|uniref:Molybdenum ABC transporter ATP-binding protein n=1 Tax=Marinomonas profundi TaxID=2726122 RepID=A0A847R2Y3_9GAMM|nr:molybdenum ABC transporter ATP-binding protein [Marinomonas profundi]NLQ18251.1 molybdenum ABC transporter ATP-binding protein [Marinomonas profundi]UDV03602.1 molybdenum ABC transporter ATP-binding protein [Marinomonas profundi]